MANEKITAIVEEIKSLTILELNELVKALEEEFGVSAAAPVAVAGAVAGAAAIAAFAAVVLATGFAAAFTFTLATFSNISNPSITFPKPV